ncbi:hypothetical protein [Streptomyces coffeae]|uniref:Uncharacterized protein n=1 Tax=Streptomyces coffeae TaxID=621382 RepID=A0ABS1NPE3_9ACTN|nr:hypothetical protein [Streptomyces coffeae]MBL1101804.1 hypothetical protein [Streptomyces coffeae]
MRAFIGAALGPLLLTGISAATAQAAPPNYSIAVARTPAVETVYANTDAAVGCKLITIMCVDVRARVNVHSMTLKTNK